MHTAPASFSIIATELEYLHSRRESIMSGAFEALVDCCPALAGLLLETLGSRRRAALWLSVRQRAFEGHTAWDLLAEGDEETVWDAVSRLARMTREGADIDQRGQLHAA
jgi:hypothetical protein